MIDKLIRWTILGTIAGVILAFNLYHADYKLLVAQVGMILLGTLYLIRLCNIPVIASEAKQSPEKPLKSFFSENILRLLRFARNDREKDARNNKREDTQNDKRKNARNDNMFYIWMGVFLLVCVASYMSSEYKAVSGQELFKVSSWIIFAMVIGSRLKAQGSKQIFLSQIVNVWLVCAGVVSLYGICQFFGMDFMKIELPFRRVSSTFGNPTIFAGFLAMTLPMAVVRDKGHGIRDKVLNYCLIGLLVLALILTRSRAGILAGLIGVVLVWMLCGSRSVIARSEATKQSQDVPAKRSFKQFSRRLLHFVRNDSKKMITMTIIALAIVLIIPQIREIVLDNLLRKTARVYLWGDVLEMIKQNVWYGSGIGTFSIYFPEFANPAIFRIHPAEWEFVNRAHSEYLELLAEMGIIGLVTFLCIIGVVITSFIKKLKAGKADILLKGLFVSFVVILIHNLISVDMRYTSTGLFFWMMGGILGGNILSLRAERGNLEENSFKKDFEVNYDEIASSTSSPRNDRKILSFLIISVAMICIYFTIKPYILMNRVEGQEFFIDSDEEIAEVGNLENMTHEKTFNLGVRYAKKKEFNTAKRLFIETLIKNPEHAGALNNLGNIAFLSGDAGRARALFHKALKFEPDNVEYLVNFAYACFKLNFMREAMDALDKALEIEPENDRALLLRRQMTQ